MPPAVARPHTTLSYSTTAAISEQWLHLKDAILTTRVRHYKYILICTPSVVELIDIQVTRIII